MKTAPLIHRISKPSRWAWGRIEPMSHEDAEFWKLRKERERKEPAR